MALRNVFRDRKRAAVVLLSLFLGLTTFITITTLVTSMDTDSYVASYVENDFILTNNTTAYIGGDVEPKQKFTDDFLDAIRDIPGFISAEYDTADMFSLTYTDGFDAHLRSVVAGEDISVEALSRIKDDFTCVAVGIDGSALAGLNRGCDIEAFERGEYLLFAVQDQSLYNGVESVEIRSWPDGDVIRTVPLEGFVPYWFHASSHSVAPTLVMSNALMDELTGGAVRSKLYIDVAENHGAHFLSALKTLTDGDYEISRVSKIEAAEELRDSKIILYILGGGIAFVLGLIGVLNFVNVMSVGIMVRKREFATLESVGMSRKQIRDMLLYEGAGYAIITLLLVTLAGNPITYGAFKLFQRQATYAVFTYPVIPVMITALIILTVCIVTPEIAYRGMGKMTLAERLRDAE